MTETVKQIVERQADDAELWFEAQHITESILQAALRELHAAVERDDCLAEARSGAADRLPPDAIETSRNTTEKNL